jgi:hypothetical protein
MDWIGWGKAALEDDWQRVVGPFATIGECAKALADEGQRRGYPGHLQVMTTGAGPRDIGRERGTEPFRRVRG